MIRFLTRRLVSLILTMLLVSIAVFVIAEAAPVNVIRNMIGVFATPEQEASLREQYGLNRPLWVRYVSWLVGSDLLWARPRVGLPLRETVVPQTGFGEWWAEEPDGTLIRWRLEGADLIAMRRQPDGTVLEAVDNGRWKIDVEAEVERLGALRDEINSDPQLLPEAREAIIAELNRLVESLNDAQEMSTEELLSEITIPEQALADLMDMEASREREALQAAASEISMNDVIQALNTARDLSATSTAPEEDYLRTVPNILSKAGSALAKERPDLNDQLRVASKAALKRDLESMRASLSEVVQPLAELVKPLTDLVVALESDQYLQAAALLEDMLDPSSELDAATTTLLMEQFKKTSRSLADSIPELSERFDVAYKALKDNDVGTAREALAEAAAFLMERGYVFTRNRIAQEVMVARYFWGVDQLNHAVLWQTNAETAFWSRGKAAGMWVKQSGGAVEYIPLQRGLLRGDLGMSMRTRQPVTAELVRRLRNSIVLAAVAFAVIMPFALLMGLVAGLNEGKAVDRILSIMGLLTTMIPSFALAIFLIIIFSLWLKILPGATIFYSSTAVFENPKMLILPVATLTLIEWGYVLRMTRASMVDVMKTAYIRTSFLKGLPYWHIVFKHALRNALMAPVTIIMLHVNWLMGGIVVVESIFGYPGLGQFLLSSALYKDVTAIEAGAIVMAVLAVSTQLIADIAYMFLNPRIRYN
jgi:ABC-type dipeptide/oligopeptide/nickel transport system permease component